MIEKQKSFRLNFRWKDEFLSWNASQAGGIDQLRLDLDDIWIPDIEVYNLVSRKGLRDREQVMDLKGPCLAESFTRNTKL